MSNLFSYGGGGGGGPPPVMEQEGEWQNQHHYNHHQQQQPDYQDQLASTTNATSDQVFDFLLSNPPPAPTELDPFLLGAGGDSRSAYQQQAQRASSLNQAAWGQQATDAADDPILQQHIIQQQIALEQIQKQQQQQQQQQQMYHQHASLPDSSRRSSAPASALEQNSRELLLLQHHQPEQAREVLGGDDYQVQYGRPHDSPRSVLEDTTSASAAADPKVTTATVTAPATTKSSSSEEAAKAQASKKEQEEAALTEADEIRAIAAIQVAEDRVSQGQCPSCGQQLYKMVRKNASGNNGNGSTPRWKRLFNFNNNSAATGPEQPLSSGSRSKSASNLGSSASANNNNKDGTVLLRKAPLHIPGVVHRGQCVKCSKANAEAEEEEEENGNVFLRDDEFEEDEYLQNSILTPLNRPTTQAETAKSSRRPSPPPAPTTTYTGPTNDAGERHGMGTLKWSNGDVYKGMFVKGVRQGPGTLTFATNTTSNSGQAGGEYVGDWDHNMMHGQGTRRFPNGDLYTGPYVDNQRQGRNGRFYFANGDLYVGDWHGDAMHGFGRYYYHHGQRFEGEFMHGQRHGKGKLQRLDGSLDIYRYQHNQRSGVGVRWSADRLKAWKLTGNNADATKAPKKKTAISIAQAVSLVYQIEGTMESMEGSATASSTATAVVDGPMLGQGGTAV